MTKTNSENSRNRSSLIKPAGKKVKQMKGMLYQSIRRGSAALMLLAAAAPAQAERLLTDMSINPGSGAVQVKLQLDQAAPEPSVFALETPPRISIDLPDTTLALKKRRMALTGNQLQALTAVEAGGRSRVVISMTSLLPYDVTVEGDAVLVTLSTSAAESVGAPVPANVSSTSAQGEAPTRAAPEISSVDFRRSESGAGQLIVTTSGKTANVDVRNEGGKIVALFRGTPPRNELISRLDVLDFATPVKFIDIADVRGNGQLSITPTSGAEFDQVAYQLGNTFTLELQPLSEAEVEERQRAKPLYTGERLNVNFQNIEVRALLQIIADVAGKNLVAADSVSGNITLRLENVPWDQALDIVLRTKGLSKDSNGDVIWVAPTAEIVAQQEQESKRQQQAEQLAPLVGEIMQINYAKAADIQALLTAEGSNFISERGTVAVDERTNVLIVNDTREKLASIQSLARRLDIPVKQVLIDSRVVVATDDFARSIGSSIGVGFSETSGSTTIAGSGNIDAATELQNLVSGSNFAFTQPNRLSTAFGAVTAGATAPSYALSILGSDYLVDLELSAFQAEGKGEVVSSPRVITADGKEAVIEQGEEIPYTTSSGTGGPKTLFKEALLQLRVTPQITPDNRVLMDLQVSKDSRGDIVPQATGGSAVAIDTSSVNTQVLVNNGETVVLGGIFEQTVNDTVNKVPLLGDIPLLGVLFRSKSQENTKRELLIFVTPKIIAEGIKQN